MKLTRLKAQLERFKKDEDGSITAYIVATFLLMVLATGMAIDLMRHEVARADVQNALDRGVLAAAALSQTEDRKLVVETYMNSRNFHELDDPELIISTMETSAKRSYIAAKAKYEVPTWFMKMIGITELTAPAASSALQGLTEIEIVLVLDESASMSYDSPTRISSLKTAATSFVTEVMSEGGDNYTTVAIVPFSTTVAMQDLMKDQYDGDKRCLFFRPGEQQRLGISQTKSDYVTDTSGCQSTSGETILPFTNDEAALTSFIGDMGTILYTSQQTGVKWAVSMLDPSFRDVMQGMVADMKTYAGEPENGEDWAIPAHTYIDGMPVTTNDGGDKIVDLARANVTPRDYGDQGVQKILVIMTDGHNRPHGVSDYGTPTTQQLNEDVRSQCDIIHGRTGGAVLDQDGTEVWAEDRNRTVDSETGAVTNPLENFVVYTIAFNLTESEVDAVEDLDDGYNEYTKALEVLSDDPDVGCASEGNALVASNNAELIAAFESIAADVSSLKLVN